ncbi:MAG: phosphate ABC transporter permease subunit PstC [Planctomycetota bacterium]
MSPSSRDLLFVVCARAAAGMTAGLLLVIVACVATWALPAIRDVGLARFVSDGSWHPREGTYDLLPMLVGSLLVTAGAVACAAPIGILAAVCANFHAPAPLAWLLRRTFEVLGAVPSVVFGLWGLVSIVPWVAAIAPPGPSLFSAMAVLALMIVPTVALTADAALRAVPAELIRGAVALGLGRAGVLRHVVIPTARPGLVAGNVLAVGRALGETMAVLMVCGNVVQIPGSLFDPVRTVTANIALEMGYATGSHRSALFVSALALVLLVALLATISNESGSDRA